MVVLFRGFYCIWGYKRGTPIFGHARVLVLRSARLRGSPSWPSDSPSSELSGGWSLGRSKGAGGRFGWFSQAAQKPLWAPRLVRWPYCGHLCRSADPGSHASAWDIANPLPSQAFGIVDFIGAWYLCGDLGVRLMQVGLRSLCCGGPCRLLTGCKSRQPLGQSGYRRLFGIVEDYWPCRRRRVSILT